MTPGTGMAQVGLWHRSTAMPRLLLSSGCSHHKMGAGAEAAWLTTPTGSCVPHVSVRDAGG